MYLFTSEGKGEFSSISTRDDGFWSVILKWIFLTDPMKTYALFLLTFTFKSNSLFESKIDFSIYNKNQQYPYWNMLLLYAPV